MTIPTFFFKRAVHGLSSREGEFVRTPQKVRNIRDVNYRSSIRHLHGSHVYRHGRARRGRARVNIYRRMRGGLARAVT